MDLNQPVLKAIGLAPEVKLSADNYGSYFTDRKLKNGFLMVVLEFSVMNGQLAEMKQMSEGLIGAIDRELMKP